MAGIAATAPARRQGAQPPGRGSERVREGKRVIVKVREKKKGVTGDRRATVARGGDKRCDEKKERRGWRRGGRGREGEGEEKERKRRREKWG